jgi:hypothetical protein
MRIKIKREELLYQLPSGDLPPFLILEGLMIDDEGLQDEFEKKYPKIRSIFSLAQYPIVRELYFSSPNVVSRLALYTALNSERPHINSYGISNSINVQIKEIRRIIQEHHLPFSIATHRISVSTNRSGYSLKIL